MNIFMARLRNDKDKMKFLKHLSVADGKGRPTEEHTKRFEFELCFNGPILTFFFKYRLRIRGFSRISNMKWNIVDFATE